MNEEEAWDSLKKKVLQLSGITTIESRDCKTLAIHLSDKTKKNISETTLKRIFGFATAHFEASTKTKNILSQYCEYKDWNSCKLSLTEKLANRVDHTTIWVKMKAETDRVDFFMLNAVKNRAVIPFNKMIERKFIHDHFKAFDQSGALATVISAPTGYGKTIALCQWLNEKLSIKDRNDLFLYLNSSFLLSSLETAVNLNYWMMKMIGLAPSNDFQQLLFEGRNNEEKFYFVIDGFDEWMFRKQQFEGLSHLLLDILSIYKSSSWFKIIIVMRDSTWLNWRNLLMVNPSSWYVGKMNEQGRNAELFTVGELQALIHRKRPFTRQEIIGEDFISLRLPIFHYYFFRKYNSIIRYEQFDDVILFELASDYMSENIINGSQTLAKMDFIFYLLNNMDYTSGSYTVNKSRLKIHQKGFLSTYLALIQLGFILETEKVSYLNKQVYIHFSHQHLLGCSIAAYILRNDSQFSPVKIEYIHQRWSRDFKLKINILKWCIFQNRSLATRKNWIEGYREHLNPQELSALNDFISLMET